MAESDFSINDAVTMRVGPGSTLGRIDQYELLRELGGGGFGTVYLARDTVSGIDVAVKGLPPFVRNNREEMENIRSNFALVSRLTHTNIAKALVLHPAKAVAYSSDEVHGMLRVDSGDTLMVMEYAPGVTLSQWRKQFPDRKVPIEQALEIARQIASALDYAHERRIVHRDIKPANVMIETAEDGSVTARVLDFGLAAEIRSSMGRVSREIHDTSGTRPYMAPEQWLGGKQGPATDQYALAALFCELVTGDVPFAAVFDTGDPVVMMNVVGREPFAPPQDLPKPIRLALARGLAKNPEDRFASCGDFIAALEGNAKSFSRKERKGKKGEASGNGGSGKIVAAVALVAALACGGYFGWMKYDEGVKAREAEQARVAAEKAAEAKRIKHEVYELKGKASQARDKNEKEEWHKWPHFGVKAKELEGAFRAGEAAFAKDDFEVARAQFLKVRDNWYWLSSNKIARAEALAMMTKVDKAAKEALSVCAAKYDAEKYAVATNAHVVASRKFDDGDFSGALSAFDGTASAFGAAVSSVKAKVEAEKARQRAEREKRLAALDDEIKGGIGTADASDKAIAQACDMLRDVLSMMPLAMDKLGVMAPERRDKFIFGLAGLACTNCIAFMLDENILRVNDVSVGGFLHLAAACGQVEVMDFLIRRGADVNLPDKNGQTPISWALCGRKNLATVKYLVAKGARVSNVFGDLSLLQDAVSRNEMDVVRYMIEDMGYRPDSEESSKLLSSKSVSSEAMEYLKGHGVRDIEKERLLAALRAKILIFPNDKEKYLEILHSCMAKYPDDGYVLLEQGCMKMAALEGMPNYKEALDCFKRSERAGCPYASIWLGILYYNGIAVHRDEAKAKEFIAKGAAFVETQADNGDLIAKSFLADLYELGMDREADPVRAFKMKQELIDAGMNKTSSVARNYWNGKGCEKDTNKAIDLMERGASSGLFEDQADLAYFCFAEGRKTEARKWFDLAREKLLSAAKQGHRYFQKLVCCMCYWEEMGFSWNNVPDAIGWLESSAATDSADAYWLAEMYGKGKYVKQDEWEATRWYLKAAEGGHALAQAEVGERYEKGKGCAKDIEKAFAWNQKAANQDISWAQYRMANYLVNGMGCSKNVYEGVRWLKKAADADFLPAIFDYGNACARGAGVRQDNDEAVKWLTKAAERDHLGAVCALANAYASGNEFARRDLNKAFYWLRKAARLGDEGAREVLRRKNMSW